MEQEKTELIILERETITVTPEVKKFYDLVERAINNVDSLEHHCYTLWERAERMGRSLERIKKQLISHQKVRTKFSSHTEMNKSLTSLKAIEKRDDIHIQ